MRYSALSTFGLALANVLLVLLLSPFFEGVLRKLKAVLNSRQGQPIVQPYLDTLKLIGKEEMRTTHVLGYDVLPSLSLGAILLLATLVPIGGPPPLAFAGDVIGLLYIAGLTTVLLILN